MNNIACRESYNMEYVLIRLTEEWRKNLGNNFFIGAVLMDLSKAFDCISPMIVSPPKQCVSVNNIKSTFKEIIWGVPQGSIIGPILFDIFFNDFFYFLLVASAHNFADDNTLSSFAKTIENLISILESESEIAISWLKDNHMIVNPGKFQAIIFDKHKGNHTD